MYCAMPPDYGCAGPAKPAPLVGGGWGGGRLCGGFLRGRRHGRTPRVVVGLRRDCRRVTVGQLTQRLAERCDVTREVRADARRLDLVALPATVALRGVVLTEAKAAADQHRVALVQRLKD